MTECKCGHPESMHAAATEAYADGREVEIVICVVDKCHCRRLK